MELGDVAAVTYSFKAVRTRTKTRPFFTKLHYLQCLYQTTVVMVMRLDP